MKAAPCWLYLFKVIICGRLSNQYANEPIYLPHLLGEKNRSWKIRGVRKGVKGFCSLKPALLGILLESHIEFAVIQV